MDDYLALSLFANPGESAGDFKARLSAFWSHLLRQRPDDFARVYAEAVAFDTVESRLAKRYLIEAGVADVLEAELMARGLDHQPIDRDDVYSKYEAAPPDWFWIEH